MVQRWCVTVVLAGLLLAGTAVTHGQTPAPATAPTEEELALKPPPTFGQRIGEVWTWFKIKWQLGGATMWFIGFAGLLAVASAIDRGISLRRSRIVPKGLATEANNLWQQGQYEQVMQLAESSDSTLGRVVAFIVEHRNNPYDLINKAAEDIAAQAAVGTADYIIAHRIPHFAAFALRWLPAPIAARLLMRSIERHAWTFVGAGAFTVTGPWNFTIDRSQAGDRTAPPDTLFRWYAAVFARLYSRLVRANSSCTGAAPDPRYPLRWHYRIAPVTAGAARVRALPPERGAIRQSPAPKSAAPRPPVSASPPASRVPS